MSREKLSESDEITLLREENEKLKEEVKLFQTEYEKTFAELLRYEKENTELKMYNEVLEKKVVDIIEKLKWLDAKTKSEWLEKVKNTEDEDENKKISQKE